MSIDYVHALQSHKLESPRAALPLIWSVDKPWTSLLDVGCGRGTWLKAAQDLGLTDLIGVDGVEIPTEELHFPPGLFRSLDLTQPMDLGRRFDAVLCLEVAEHLDEIHAGTLIDSLARHGDRIIFSAACPGQSGFHHVNCQWPAYWQELFNQRGYVCSDELRWLMWNIPAIEPWYRQNIFIARHAPGEAGREKRLLPVRHPELFGPPPERDLPAEFAAHARQIAQGRMPLVWYLTVPFRAIGNKAARKLGLLSPHEGERPKQD